jgi:SdpC family antimicrobial peptide
MKLIKISNRAKVALVFTSFALIVGLFSFVKPNLAVKQKATGSDLFEGIFFLKGEVARQLPVLKTLNKYSTNEMSPTIQLATNQRQKEFISILEQKDKMFLTHFQSEMTSGDGFRISAMLVKAGDLAKEVLKEMPQLGRPTATNSKGNQVNGLALDTYCEIVVYNPCDVYVQLIIDKEDGRQEPFTKELLVKQIIEHFESN